MVIERAQHRPAFSAMERGPANRVPGCRSPVWLIVEREGDRCRVRGDADSPLVRGLVLLLCEFFDGATPTDIQACTVDPLEHLLLTRTLSPTRRHGLQALRRDIDRHAAAL